MKWTVSTKTAFFDIKKLVQISVFTPLLNVLFVAKVSVNLYVPANAFYAAALTQPKL